MLGIGVVGQIAIMSGYSVIMCITYDHCYH